ncbi:hypothetical protein ABL78_1073 [Leptomonas seymouri]|uniref:Uncharacterized protein n=1 Tax=Leptomonas seymouri TaxID=5684 RepID=A0A0N1I162_LEPSE|nr:hypothetical protein ABL78_1073 [Leptomonas seymouri]|eukprot:KPI89810.1 hypothetical protein ABL78_1073 [Leptomonas seymouri]
MTLDHVLDEWKNGVEYPANTPERFAAALQQFVWSSGRRSENEASWGISPSSLDKERALSPLPSSEVTHMLQALRSVLDAARCCSCCSRADPVTEAGLFMMRLTRLMERQTLTCVHSEMDSCLREAASLVRVSPPAQSPNVLLDANRTSFADKGGASHGIHTVLSCGRRYTVPEASSSYSSLSVLEANALSDLKLEASTGKSVPLIWRFHADLTLQLQQCMLRSMCLLDAALIDHSADDGGLCGVLTHSRAAQFQGIFVSSIIATLSSVQDRWRTDFAITGSTEAVREVTVALERLQQAAHAQHTGMSPPLHVFELSTAKSARCSPPPFAWRRRSSTSLLSGREDGMEDEAADASPALGNHSDIERCLGVVGSDYAAKLVAQQLWCAQTLLSQRFPSYAASWGLLERARFFVESTRSPTPTVPRSDSSERPAVVGSPAAMAPSGASCPDSGLQHNGDTPPPFVTMTQRKGERPFEASKPTSPSFRSLKYSEERSEASEAAGGDVAETAPLPSRSPTAPLFHGHISAVSCLLPLARCLPWERLLEGCGVSAGSTVAAIQEQAAGKGAPPQREAQQREPLESSCSTRCFLKASSDHSLGKQTAHKQMKVCSVETEHVMVDYSASLPTRIAHARSS